MRLDTGIPALDRLWGGLWPGGYATSCAHGQDALHDADCPQPRVSHRVAKATARGVRPCSGY
jgi:hypothetical protein